MNNKHLIIAILSIIIALLCIGIAYTMLSEKTEYISTTIAESGTVLDIPNNMILKPSNNDSGITVLSNDNTVVILFNSADKGLGEIMAFATIKNPIFGNQFSGNITLNNPNIAGCSLEGECNGVFIGNDTTHDNIIVISKSKDIVNHIINSIKWGNKTISSNESSTEDTSSNENTNQTPSAYAYKADGTPMYSQEEVSNYMLNKYGMVDYHIGDNGYIDMDEPGYDDAGNKINNNKALK